MRRWIVATIAGCLAFTASVGAATLNKCIDAQGNVTYSNLPCRNAHEVRKLEIDPAPLPEPARAQPSPSKQPMPKTASSVNGPAPVQSETPRAPKARSTGKPAALASARECDALSEKLGSVLDKMDKAHRKGYTQNQMDQWNQEVRSLETQKQQSGCF